MTLLLFAFRVVEAVVTPSSPDITSVADKWSFHPQSDLTLRTLLKETELMKDE